MDMRVCFHLFLCWPSFSFDQVWRERRVSGRLARAQARAWAWWASLLHRPMSRSIGPPQRNNKRAADADIEVAPHCIKPELRLPLLNWCGKGPAANVRLASGDDQLGLSDLRFEVQPRLGAKIMLDEAMLPLPDASGGRAAGHLRIWGGSLSPMTGNSAPRGDLSIGAVSPERHTPKRPQLCPVLGPFLRPAAASARRAGPNGQNAGDPSDDDLVHRRRATSTPTRKASACRGACRVQRLRE